MKSVPRLVAGSEPPLEPGGLGVGSWAGSCLEPSLVPAAGSTPRIQGKPPSIFGSGEVIPRLLYIILIEVGEAGTDPAPEGTLRVPFARILKGGSEPTREPSCSLFGNRPTRQSRAPLRIRNRYCQFPSYFVFLCARAKSVLATQRKLAERFAVHLVELFDRHWRPQVRSESFDKVGK